MIDRKHPATLRLQWLAVVTETYDVYLCKVEMRMSPKTMKVFNAPKRVTSVNGNTATFASLIKPNAIWKHHDPRFHTQLAGAIDYAEKRLQQRLQELVAEANRIHNAINIVQGFG